MAGETTDQMRTTSTKVEKYENPSDNRDTRDALTYLSTDVEAWTLEQEVMLTQVRDLLNKYKSLKKWIHTSEGNMQTKRQLTHWLNENIENLKNIRKDLWWRNEDLKADETQTPRINPKAHKYSNLTTYKARIWELLYFYEHYEQVRQIITLWWMTWDIHAIIDSKQDAKKARRYEKKDNKSQQEMNRILHDVALTSLRNNDMERYEEYLEAVVNWQIEPSSHPFYKAHCQSFNMIKHTNPSLYQMLVPSWWKRVQYWTPVIIWEISTWQRVRVPRQKGSPHETFHSRVGKKFWELMWNIFQGVENDPRKKQAWEQFGSVAVLGWAIFMWFKAIQKAIFTKKEEDPKKRWKAAWWAAWLLALTNSDKIGQAAVDWIQNVSWWHPAEKVQASSELLQSYWFTDKEALRIAEMHISAPIATLSALHFVPIYELHAQRIVEYQNNKFKFNYDNYKQYVDAYNWTADQKKVVLEAWENLNNNDSLNDGLNALGIYSQAELDRIAGWDRNKTLADDENIHKRYLECAAGISSGVNKELYERWLKAKDAVSAKRIVKEYDENEWKDIDKLIEKRSNEWLLEVATDCPMVRLLSDLWIKIEDPTEIKKTEERLNNIKEWMRYQAPWTEWYKPYSIEWNKLMFTTSDTESAQKIHIPDDVQDRFPDQHRTLNDFPTVSNNREKFLEFMNDPKNHMRWKEISSKQV